MRVLLSRTARVAGLRSRLPAGKPATTGRSSRIAGSSELPAVPDQACRIVASIARKAIASNATTATTLARASARAMGPAPVVKRATAAGAWAATMSVNTSAGSM